MQERDEDLFASYVELDVLDKKILKQQKDIILLVAISLILFLLFIGSTAINCKKH